MYFFIVAIGMKCPFDLLKARFFALDCNFLWINKTLLHRNKHVHKSVQYT
jgi:hypothetical protein